MGVDQSKVKQRAEEEQQKSAARAAGGFKYWNPKTGKNRIRFMPPWKNCTHGGSNQCQLPECKTADQFWREVHVHWGIGADDAGEGGQSFACPVKTPWGPSGATCPVCVHVSQLRATKDAADAELANQLRAKERYYSNIVDIDDPVFTAEDVNEWKARQEDKTRECPFKPGDTKVQVFSYGPMIYKDLLDIFSEVDISDLAQGHDVDIMREGQGRETKYRTRAVFNPSPFNVKGRDIQQAVIDLDRLMPFAPAEQMQAALNGEAPPPGAQRQVAAAKPAPGLPAPAPQPQAAAPKPQLPAPQPQAAAPAPQRRLPQAPAQRPADAPPCWHDLKTVSNTDTECVGGQNAEGDIFDPCPYFQSCTEVKAAAAAPQPAAQPTRRAGKKATPTVPNAQPETVDDLEAEMRQSLNS